MGVLLINAHVLLNTLGNSMYKVIKNEASVQAPDFLLIRYGLICLFTLIALKKAGVNPFTDVTNEHQSNQRLWLFFRCIFGMAGFAFLTIAVGMIPLSIAMVIVMTNPFLTMALTYFINGTLIKSFEIAAMMACFFGVVVIVTYKPTEHAHQHDHTVHALQDNSNQNKSIGFLIAGMTAISFAI